VRMVGDMQEWGYAEVPGRRKPTSIIDSLHFVSSRVSPGVEMADLIAYVLHRHRSRRRHRRAGSARPAQRQGQRPYVDLAETRPASVCPPSQRATV